MNTKAYVKGKNKGSNEFGIFTAEIDEGCLPCISWHGKVVVYGNSQEEVDEITTRIIDELNGTEVPSPSLNYEAAFNAWQDDYIKNPQAYEDSHTTALKHVTEKLNGQEPSYGQVAARMFQQYLEQVGEL